MNMKTSKKTGILPVILFVFALCAMLNAPFAYSADKLVVKDSGGIATTFKVDDTGKVVIGPSAPAAFLDVSPGTITGDAFRVSATDTNNTFQLKIQGHTGGSSHAQFVTDQANSRITIMAGEANDFAPRYQAIGPQDVDENIRGWALFDFGSSIYDLPNAELRIRHYDTTGPVNMMQVVGADKVVFPTGNVGIGTVTPAYKLDVDGDINTTGDILKSGVAYNNPDYVFDPDYKLMSLTDLKKFLVEKRHLPNVPSTAEIRKEGVKLFEQNRVLLEKLEESYLYIIGLEERLAKIESVIGQSPEVKQ